MRSTFAAAEDEGSTVAMTLSVGAVGAAVADVDVAASIDVTDDGPASTVETVPGEVDEVARSDSDPHAVSATHVTMTNARTIPQV